MRPGSIIVLFVMFALCGAVIQIASPSIRAIQDESVILYRIIMLSCLVLGFVVPFLSMKAWNRKLERDSSRK